MDVLFTLRTNKNMEFIKYQLESIYYQKTSTPNLKLYSSSDNNNGNYPRVKNNNKYI